VTYVKILIIILLSWLVMESRNDNLTKVIVEALMIDGFFHETTLPISPSTLG
jgi:hypothetical protein